MSIRLHNSIFSLQDAPRTRKLLYTFAAMISIHQAQPSDRPLLNQLLNASNKTHTHLDWHSPHSWLGKPPFFIATLNSKAIAAMAAPPDPEDTAWIRLATLSPEISLPEAFDPMWQPTLSALHDLKVKQITAMLLDDWFLPQLKRWNFKQINDVVVLSRLTPSSTRNTVQPALKGLRIRTARASDIEAINKVDAAFAAPWRYSKDTLLKAMGHVDFSSVAELDGEIVGYQISSGGHTGGHLARLAVNPECQGRGIGHALLMEITHHFERLGAPQITVNTQHDNNSSLALYRAFGFELTGEHYPVWQLEIM